MKFSKFFSNIQETPWYRSFLNPVIEEVKTSGRLLDIGTGTAKLIQILTLEKSIECVGVDTDSNMLIEAEKKINDTNIKLVKIEKDSSLPFENNSFDYITICNVLFHLDDKSVDLILDDSRRLLKKDGKIIILTPTGNNDFFSLLAKFFSLDNISILIWYFATKRRAKTWVRERYLEQYSSKNKLNYKKKITMGGFALFEIIRM